MANFMSTVEGEWIKAPMDIPLTDLTPIRELYAKGLYLQAWREAQRFGPVKDWSNAAARLLAGRLVIQLGAARLGRYLHLKAFRDTPTYHEAIYYHARYRFEKFGALSAWRFMSRHVEWYDSAPTVRADWMGLQGFIAGRMRDFDRAERYLNKADATTPGRPWLLIERASVYEFADRHEEALTCARRSQELSPYFRPGVQAEAHLLQRMGKEKEALEILQLAVQHIESGLVVAHLASLQMERGFFADARRSYERYAELSPLLEEDLQKWLAARRCDTAFFMGEWEAAREQAKLAVVAKEPYYAEFAKRLEKQSGPLPTTVRLDQSPQGAIFQRPDPETPPVELLARYWKPDAKGFQALEPVPTDGLPDPGEWIWLEQKNELRCIECTFNAETAFSVLERGIPFLLTLVDSGFSHSFVVVGCNRLRESIWMIDTSERKANEAPVAPILERYSSVGPRMLMALPKEKFSELDGIPFEDRDAFDHLHRVQSALRAEDRAAAVKLLASVKPTARADVERLAILTTLALARYDANPTKTLECLDSLLVLFPNDANFLLSRMNALRDLGRRDERNRVAREQVEKHEWEPLFAQYFAQVALADYRLYSEGILHLRRAIRKRQQNAGAYYLLANLLWEKHEYEEATEVYRFAASLEDRDEQFAEGYCRAARQQGQGLEIDRFLQGRHNRCKGQIAEPTKSLFFALAEEGEIDKAFAAVDEAIAAEGDTPSPIDAPKPPAVKANQEEIGDLYLFLAEMSWNYHQFGKFEPAMEQAEARLTPIAFARAASRLALQQVRLSDARRFNETVLQAEPRNMDAVRQQTRLVADLEGREAAVRWLEEACKRYPYLYPLQQLLIEWHRSDSVPIGVSEAPLPAEAVIRRLIADCPNDAWARRELALHLASRGRTDEALIELEIARPLEPDSPSYFYTLGHVHARADHVEEARESYERVISLSVDNDLAIGELVNLARGEEEKKEALEYVAEEIRKQPIVAEGLSTYRDQALQILEPEDILRVAQYVLDERPEIWQAWSVTIQLLSMSGRMEEAKELAKGATETFPLNSRLWVDLAEVCEAMDDLEPRIAALRRAWEVAPAWGFAARELSEALEEDEQSEAAHTILEQAVARASSDPVNHGYLADFLWNAGEGEEAFKRLVFALKLDPGYEWAWRALSEWAERLEEPERALAIARELAEIRPGDFRVWLALVRLLPTPNQNEEVLDALNKAIQLNPRCIEAYDMKAERLAEMERFDEAKATATPDIFDPDPPMILQGRAAWVEARRGNLPVAVREMQALVALEPHYYWGWQQLAEWHNELNNPEEFLEATRKLVEMRPDSPVALAMRGEAKLQVGDMEGGREDLREAQKIAPAYSYAGMLLFDSLIQDEKYDAARPVLAMLQEHVGGSGQPFVLARHAQLAARTKDEEAAETALREICLLPCDSTWPINTAVGEMRNAGWLDLVDRVLQETIENETEFHPFILMAWLEGPTGQASEAEEKLRLMDKVIEALPQSFQAYDMKAELLTRLGRYEEALKTCTPTTFKGKLPLALRGRAAWVLGSQSRLDEAIAAMKVLLEEDPEYYWGWQQLANWHDSSGNHQEYLRAAESLVRLDPGNPASHAYRGEAKLYGGDRRGAKIDFLKAFELDNSYAFAGLHLIDEQLADGELEAANSTLARLQEHNDGPYIRLRALRLAAKKKDAEGCREIFRTLALDPETPVTVIHKMIDSLQQAGYKGEIENWLSELIEEPDATPVVGRLWVEFKAAQNEYDFEEKLPALMERGDIGREAVFAAVEAFAKPNQRTRLFRLIERYGPTLERDDRGWAKVALALDAIGDYRRGNDWIEDWQNREIAAPWMLHPTALILRALGRYPEAETATRKALEIEQEDSSVPDFRVWLAFEDALRGRTANAAAQLRLVAKDQLGDVTRILHNMTEMLILVQQTSPKHRRGTFDEAKRRIRECLEELAPKERHADLSKSYQRFASRLAEDVGGLSARLWGLRQKIKPPI